LEGEYETNPGPLRMGALFRVSPLFVAKFPLMMSGLGLLVILAETGHKFAPSLTLGL
jgi:hypothetical protein